MMLRKENNMEKDLARYSGSMSTEIAFLALSHFVVVACRKVISYLYLFYAMFLGAMCHSHDVTVCRMRIVLWYILPVYHSILYRVNTSNNSVAVTAASKFTKCHIANKKKH